MTFQIAYARRPLARKNTRAGFAALSADQFEGYASLFGVPDGGGDTVAPGAFAASLRRRPQVRMLYQHFSHAPIGVWEYMAEDARGLYVRGAWRWFSLQAMVLSGVVQAAWDALPADLKQYLPHWLGLVLSLSLLLLGIGGRLVKQRKD